MSTRTLQLQDVYRAGAEPYSPQTLPVYLDQFWGVQKGRGFATSGRDGNSATQGTSYGTLNADVTVGSISLAMYPGNVAAAGFVAGETVMCGNGYVWYFFTVESISTDTLIVFPSSPVVLSNGWTVTHVWGNDTHLSDGAWSSLAGWIRDAKLSKLACAGLNLLGNVGAMSSTYTDANGKTNAPAGWQSGNGLTGAWGSPNASFTFLASNWSNTARQPNARDATGAYFATPTLNDGARTLANIPVRPGDQLSLTWQARTTADYMDCSVVDKDTPATVLAQTNSGSNPRIGTGPSGQYGNLGQRMGLAFTVPAGTTNIEIRFISTTTTASQFYFDDVRLVKAAQDPLSDRDVIEHPGARPIAVTGDSWAYDTQDILKTILPAKFGQDTMVLTRGVPGETLNLTNGRFVAEIKPWRPRYNILVSGLANDLAQGRTQSQIEGDIDTFIDQNRAIGCQPIILGVGALSIVSPSVTLSTSRDRNDQVRDRVLRFSR